MKKLVVVRHGKYDIHDHLSAEGKAQIEGLVCGLRPHINGQKVAILTSPADRAKESADILADAFGVIHESHVALWADESHRPDFSKALELVRLATDKADVVILVTHMDYAVCLPHQFAVKELGGGLKYRAPEKGEALVIDCETRTTELVKP